MNPGTSSTSRMWAPLRAMQGFSQIREEEHGSQIDEQGRNYLERITAATGWFGQVIRDIFRHTLVVREDVRLQLMHVAPLWRRLIAENPALPAPLAEVVIKIPLLPVMGHESYLTLGRGGTFSIQLNRPPEGTLAS